MHLVLGVAEMFNFLLVLADHALTFKKHLRHESSTACTSRKGEFMFSKKLAALVATSLVVATSPAIAQSAAQPVPSTAPANATIDEASELGNGYAGGGLWVALIGAALLAAFILVILDEEDELSGKPVSP